MTDCIRIKPHHFVDIIRDLGNARPLQPHPYGHAVHAVARRIRQDHDVMLEMTFGADDICAPCTHNIDGLCDDTIDISFRPDAPESKREYNLLLDQRWSDRLDLAEGDRLTARDLARRLADRAGDITDIYRETPPDRTADRAAAIAAGLKLYLP